MTLLIVEDEPKTAAYLKKGLAEAGFATELAHDGEEGLRLARHSAYDLLILDVTLPRRDGLSVVAELRRTGCRVPILVLSARDTVTDRVKGLETGADDYVVKPFAFSELLARVRTLLRRETTRHPDVLVISDLEIDLLGCKVKRAGERVALTAKEFLLLSLLARHRGEVLSRTFIAEQVWDMNYDGDMNVIDVVVRRLRQKMDEAFDTKLIRTVRGRGYVLEASDGAGKEPS
jgi:two-component system copper resistance phosphate regulon response regulator CusR